MDNLTEKTVKISEKENKTIDERFEFFQYQLPESSAKILASEKDIENYALMLHHFSVQYKIWGDKKEDRSPKPLIYVKSLNIKKFKINKHGKKEASYTHSQLNMTYCREIIKAITERNKRIAEGFRQHRVLFYTPIDKLMIGIGGESPYGNIPGMTLHHLYGLPYIPASSLKGLTRHYCQKEIYQNKDYSRAFMSVKQLNDLLGSGEEKAKRGKLIFLDVFPSAVPTIFFDAQTPHYAGYYGQQPPGPPADYGNPIPLFFPAVKPVKFTIYFGSYGYLETELLDSIQEVVKEALIDYGIGAKTAIGYGLGHVE
ncbi:type III-B CRISPR module RAMP protein Cmr6 [Desulfoscipio sp. XC116]|uniref:type III-B CRISPR module RAMP protein Cmr6 n=1 Tax=Desulfoscipio sp. XC116 TaxID=3144975 RepID=UPI00325AC8F7